MKKRNYIIFAALIVLTFALSGCGQVEQTEAQEPNVVPVEVAQITQGNVEIADNVTGQITPKLEVNVVPKMAGKVAKVNVKVGDRVSAGQVLVQLETTEIAAQVKQAEAALNAARTQLEGAMATAETNFNSAKDNLERMQYLFEQGGISEQQLQSAKTQFELAQVQLDNAKKGSVEQAEAALELTRTQLDNAVITAPASGIVSAVNVEPGELAGQTMPLVSIVELDTVLAEFNLTEGQVGLVKKGAKMEVLVKSATADALTGTVHEISPVANPQTKAFAVKVALANKNHVIKPGMSAEIKLTLDKASEALVIPGEAIMEKQGETQIYIVNEDTVQVQKVNVILESETMAAVEGEIQAGQEVVIVGKEQLQDNSKVKVVNGREL